MAAWTVHVLDDDAVSRWDAFVADCPEATFFHRAGWRRIAEHSFGHKAHFLYAERGGVVGGILPLVHVRSRLFANALVSTAFCVSGGPVAMDDTAHAALDEAAIALLDRLRADYLEYRCPARRHPNWAARDDLHATFDRTLDPDEDRNLKEIPRKQRAVIRKAMDLGALTVAADVDVDRFYPLFCGSMHTLGTPVFPRRYFHDLMKVFAGDCDILTATFEGRAVSSVLNFYFRDRVLPYYVGSTNLARGLGANDYLYWRLMRWAVETRGCQVFDFGRSKIGTGPYAFKRNWGFEPRPVVHEYLLRPGQSLPDINPLNPKYRLFIAAWRRLPQPVANLIGPWIVRGVG